MSTAGLPEPYPWPSGSRSALCFTVDVDAHSPWLWANRNTSTALLGQLEQRNFGPRVGLHRIVTMLGELGIKGTFFVPAIVAETYPDILPGLAENGHEVGLHGYFHELVAETTDEEFTRMLDASLALFEVQIGQRPKGFRSPAWEMTPHMLGELRRRGLYDSSLMGFDTPYVIDGVVEIPVQWSTNDAIYFRFLGGRGNDTGPPAGTGEVYAAWRDEFEALHRYGGLFMLTVHDWISGRAPRTAMLERLIGDALAAGDVWIATVGQIAEHHRQHNWDRNQIEEAIPESPLTHPAWRNP